MFDDLYSGVGKKIKFIAQISALIGTLGCIIIGIVFAFNKSLIYAIIYTFIGPIICWASSLILYAFGQLVENSDKTLKIREQNQIDDNDFKTRYLIAIEKIADIKPQKSKSKKIEVNESMIDENKSEKIKISKETFNKIANILLKLSNQDKLKIQNNVNYKNWIVEIQNLSINEIVERINKSDDWQEEYLILCCIELEHRGLYSNSSK